MQPPEPGEFGVFEAGNCSEDMLLGAVLELACSPTASG